MVDRSIFPTERVLNESLGTIDYVHPKHKFSLKVQKRMEKEPDNPDGKILLRIDPLKERGKFVYQMGTGEGHLALEAAEKVYRDADGIDVNMGCPKKFSVSGGMGSALLSDPKRACDIISTLSRNIPKPISAKIRLLDDTDPRPTIEFAKSLIASGATAIAVHGRIVGDESHIPARWETLVEVVRQLKQSESVPVIVNGDLYTRADINELKRRSGCDGIMLARPALYNVSLFRRGDVRSNGNNSKNGANNQRIDSAFENEIPLPKFQSQYHEGYYGYNSPLLLPRSTMIQEYIAQCVRYKAHPKNAKYVVCEMMNIRRAPTERAPFLNMNYPGGQTIADICKCRTLDDLVKVWDVRWIIPMPDASVVTKIGSGDTKDIQITCDDVDSNSTGAELFPTPCHRSNIDHDNGGVLEDIHNYDDRYFLDPDKFRKERNDAVDAALSSTAGTKSQKSEALRVREDGKKIDDKDGKGHDAKRKKLMND